VHLASPVAGSDLTTFRQLSVSWRRYNFKVVISFWTRILSLKLIQQY